MSSYPHGISPLSNSLRQQPNEISSEAGPVSLSPIIIDPAGKTLIEIASASREVFGALVRDAGHKTVESFQLEKIAVAAGAILETINGALLLENGTVDDRLKDWLSSEEPKRCLDVLNRMTALLRPKLNAGHGTRKLFQSPHSVSTKGKINEAIRIFWRNEVYFLFLLSTEIWNHESTAQQLEGPPLDTLRECEAPPHNSVLHIDQPKVGNLASTGKEKPTKKQKIDSQKLNSILKWLRAWNCKDIYERALVLRQPDTCIWLPNTNTFKTWREIKDSFLWLHGKPGAGKSILAATVIENIKGSLRDGEVLAYFYCDFRNERSTSAVEVIRSLLSQLLQQFSRHAIGPGDLIEDLIEEKEGGASPTSNVILLARYISRAAKQLIRQPFLVIDALDECADTQELLDALGELQRSGGVRLFVTGRPLPIIKDGLSNFTSIDMDMMKFEVSADIQLHVRKVLDSHRRFRGMDASLRKEMYSILCKRADAMFRWVQCQLDSLQRCLTAMQIREALHDLPSSLHSTYERILRKVYEVEREGKVARRVLTWLVVALQPLELSQIIEGLSIDPVRRTIDRDSGPVHGAALLDVLGSLVTYDEATDIVILSHFSVKEYLTATPARGSYLPYHIDAPAAHMQLFLLCISYISLSMERGQRPSVHPALPGNTCKPGMYFDDPNLGTRSTKNQRSPPPSSESYSFEEYVISCTFRHLSYINTGDRKVLHALKTLHSNAQLYPSEWGRLCQGSRPYIIMWPTLEHDFMLYIIIAFARPPLLRSFIGRAQLKCKDGTNPLIYVAHFGTAQHAEILLSSGVSLVQKGRGCYSDDYQLPIEAALRSQNLRIINLFLTEGSPVPCGLFESVFKRYRDLPVQSVLMLLRTDEFVEWATNSQDEILLGALDPTRYLDRQRSPSESQQNMDMVQQRLVQIGCDPSTRFNQTSLRCAVAAGHVSTARKMLSHNVPLPPDIILDASHSPMPNAEMIRLCLSAGCDVHATSPIENTPVHLILISLSNVSEDDYLESLGVLIDAGCDPSMSNLVGETPLHLAVRLSPFISVAEYLLQVMPLPLPSDILITAAKSCTISMLELVIRRGAEVHTVASNGDTPLHRVLNLMGSSEALNCVKFLLKAGCDPRSPNAQGKTPFDIAVIYGNLSVVKYLQSILNPPFSQDILLSVASGGSSPLLKLFIDRGASMNVTQPSGNTPLHLAVTAPSRERERLKRIQVLINAGCDPNACNLAGETPFHLAARRGYTQVMEYLHSLGVSVPPDIILTLLEGPGGGSLGSSCFLNPHSVPFLLDNGANVHTVAKNGDTLLHLAAESCSDEEALVLAKYLIHAGCIPNAPNCKRETPLHVAARNGHFSLVKYLLSLYTKLPPNILLATLAGWRDQTHLIRYLIQEGADVSATTADGDSPLHLLLNTHLWEDDRLECVKVLVKAGCDPCAQNVVGETPLHVAARHGPNTILEYLLLQGVPLSQDILSVVRTPATLRFLLGKGLDLRSMTAQDMTKLMCRVLEADSHWKNHSVEFARILIDVGWDPRLGALGEAPIHVAVKHGLIAAVKFFLSQGVLLPTHILLDAPSLFRGDTPDYHTYPLIRYLLREGASVNVATTDGDTPLHLVMRCHFIPDSCINPPQQRSWELVKILLDGGSDPYSRNADGRTPYDLAEAKGHYFKENFLRLVRNAQARRLRS